MMLRRFTVAATAVAVRAMASEGSRRQSSSEKGFARSNRAAEKTNHFRMIMTCIGCAAAGYAAGELVPVKDPPPKFDKDEIVEKLRKTFDFRPDLATLALRVAFSLAAARAGTVSEDIMESCSVLGTGFTDLSNVVGFSLRKNNISVEDMVALMAITAAEYLGFPKGQLVFRWGREDTAVDKKPAPVVPTSKGKLRGLKALLSKLGDLSEPEMVALLACHSVGEFHNEVSGFPDFANRTPYPLFLGNQYFKVLTENEKKLVERPLLVETVLVGEKPTKDAVTGMTVDVPDPKKPKSTKRLHFCPHEVDCLLKRDKSVRKWVEVFAKDEKEWEKHFASAFQKMLESNFSNQLKEYPVEKGGNGNESSSTGS